MKRVWKVRESGCEEGVGEGSGCEEGVEGKGEWLGKVRGMFVEGEGEWL